MEDQNLREPFDLHSISKEKSNLFSASCSVLHESQKNLSIPVSNSIEENRFRHWVMEQFCSTSTDKSRKHSSLLVILSQQRHLVSLASTPSVKLSFPNCQFMEPCSMSTICWLEFTKANLKWSMTSFSRKLINSWASCCEKLLKSSIVGCFYLLVKLLEYHSAS